MFPFLLFFFRLTLEGNLRDNISIKTTTTIVQHSPEIHTKQKVDDSNESCRRKVNSHQTNERRLIRSISGECLEGESVGDTEFLDSISIASGIDNRSDSILGRECLKPLKRRDTNNISLVPADYSINEHPLRTNVETGKERRISSGSTTTKGSVRSFNTFPIEPLPEYPTLPNALGDTIEVCGVRYFT